MILICLAKSQAISSAQIASQILYQADNATVFRSRYPVHFPCRSPDPNYKQAERCTLLFNDAMVPNLLSLPHHRCEPLYIYPNYKCFELRDILTLQTHRLPQELRLRMQQHTSWPINYTSLRASITVNMPSIQETLMQNF